MNKAMPLAALMGALFLASFAAPADVGTAQRIVEMKGGGESLWVFAQRLPSSFEAQVFYGLFLSGLAGTIGSFLWKWSQGVADLHHFTARYAVGQWLWLIGSSIAAIMTVGFQTESGEFFGWLAVLWSGGFAGFSGEVKVKKTDTGT